MVAGGYHSLALSWEGDLLSWGDNSSSQLGKPGNEFEDEASVPLKTMKSRPLPGYPSKIFCVFWRHHKDFWRVFWAIIKDILHSLFACLRRGPPLVGRQLLVAAWTTGPGIRRRSLGTQAEICFDLRTVKCSAQIFALEIKTVISRCSISVGKRKRISDLFGRCRVSAGLEKVKEWQRLSVC